MELQNTFIPAVLCFCRKSDLTAALTAMPLIDSCLIISSFSKLKKCFCFIRMHLFYKKFFKQIFFNLKLLNKNFILYVQQKIYETTLKQIRDKALYTLYTFKGFKHFCNPMLLLR